MTALRPPWPADPAASGGARATRLTAGWQHAGRAATLREHLERYGQLPRHGRGNGRGHSPGAGRGHGDQEDLAEAVADAGLTGRGGAGFPTATKISAVAAGRGPAVVVANGMESEPASEKDQALLARAPHLVLDGIALAARAVRADVAYLCLSRSRPWQLQQLAAAAGERRAAGVDQVRVELRSMPRHFVSSEETALVHWLNGGEARPQTTPPRPSERGVGRRPTLVNNVETLANIALIARYGAAWFRQAGQPDAPGTMLVTISGAVSGPGVYEIELGTTVGDVLAASGVSPAVGAVLIGGYFGTWHDASRVAGAAMTTARLRQVGAAPGAGVLVALPPGACGLAETARMLGFLAGQSAGQCGPCVFGLPAIAADFAQLAAGRPQGALRERLDRRLAVIAGRGACRHPDGAIRLAASALTAFAADAGDHLRRRPCLAARRGNSGQGVLPVPGYQAGDDWR